MRTISMLPVTPQERQSNTIVSRVSGGVDGTSNIAINLLFARVRLTNMRIDVYPDKASSNPSQPKNCMKMTGQCTSRMIVNLGRTPIYKRQMTLTTYLYIDWRLAVHGRKFPVKFAQGSSAIAAEDPFSRRKSITRIQWPLSGGST